MSLCPVHFLSLHFISKYLSMSHTKLFSCDRQPSDTPHVEKITN